MQWILCRPCVVRTCCPQIFCLRGIEGGFRQCCLLGSAQRIFVGHGLLGIESLVVVEFLGTVLSSSCQGKVPVGSCRVGRLYGSVRLSLRFGSALRMCKVGASCPCALPLGIVLVSDRGHSTSDHTSILGSDLISFRHRVVFLCLALIRLWFLVVPWGPGAELLPLVLCTIS